MKLRYFENSVTFVQRYKLTAEKYHIKGFLEYGACNDQSCLPPTQVDFDYTGTGKPEQLKGCGGTLWSRRITQKHRLIYEIIETVVHVDVLSAYGHYDDK